MVWDFTSDYISVSLISAPRSCKEDPAGATEADEEGIAMKSPRNGIFDLSCFSGSFEISCRIRQKGQVVHKTRLSWIATHKTGVLLAIHVRMWISSVKLADHGRAVPYPRCEAEWRIIIIPILAWIVMQDLRTILRRTRLLTRGALYLQPLSRNHRV